MPPLRDTSTTSLQFYQPREENALLAPELMTPSPMSRTPINIRTNTTGTSPTRPFDDNSHSFRHLNQEEVFTPNISANLEVLNRDSRTGTSDDRVNLNVTPEETPSSSHDSTSNVGRAMRMDDSL